MAVNLKKTKMVHFRKKSQPRSSHTFKYGDDIVHFTSEYKYLGIYFDEHLCFDFHEEQLAAAGSCALGSVINKLKKNDCMTYETYNKCIKCSVAPVIEYGSEITGIYKQDKLNRVIDSSARAFLGVHKFCPIASMYKDLGWVTNACNRKVNVLRYWNRLIQMDNSRLTKEIFNINHNHPTLGSWCYHVKNIFRQLNMTEVFLEKKICNLDVCKTKLISLEKDAILKTIDSKPKLRIYKQIMTDGEVEKYVKLNISSGERSMLAQLRMGILPLRIETGRYTNMKLSERFCQICNVVKIEDELHFIFTCTKYEQTRKGFLEKMIYKCKDVESFNEIEKFRWCCSDLVRQFAKYLVLIFKERKDCEYKNEV